MKINTLSLLCAISILMFRHYTEAQGVGLGTNMPNVSAVLDLTSTNGGFLPPRMTLAQRNMIPTPARALMIYCTDCGTLGEPQFFNGLSWTNMIGGPSTPVLIIGLDYQGGKIAYILQPGDPGYIAGQVQGFIAASADQSLSMVWDDDAFVVTGANATAIGTGNANTNTIVTVEGAGTYAAKLCSDLSLNGYSDWFLPSKDELNKLYINRVAIGGFVNSLYWCSTENDMVSAFLQDFNTGSQMPGSKNIAAHVRAIRSF